VLGIKAAAARFLTPWIWRAFPGRRLLSLRRYADAELDSGWQLLRALPHFEDPTVRSCLFCHALEEFGHARLFEELLERGGGGLLSRTVHGREPLLPERPTDEERSDFLAYFHVGEREVFGDFSALSRAPLDPALREVFARIVREEEGHDEGALALLKRTDGGKDQRWRLLRQRWRRDWEGTMRFLRRADGPLFVSLAVVYYALGGFFYRGLRRRMELGREQQLDILREQVHAHAVATRAS
jgi:hypothetical protein